MLKAQLDIENYVNNNMEMIMEYLHAWEVLEFTK